jgi:hypothetical protein
MGDFINKLLKRNKNERLGNKSIDEIINHSLLEGVDWKIIELKLVDSEYIPFVPSIGDNFDSNVANKKDNIIMEHYEENLKKINDLGYFKYFYFNYYSNINKTKSKLIHEKTSISHKYTTVTEGMKSTPTQSEGDPESNDISIGNNNNISLIKSISIQNFQNNSELTKKNGQTDSDFPKKSKTNYIKSTSILKKRIIYDKGQLIEMNKSDLSKDKEENESFNNNEYNENEKIS